MNSDFFIGGSSREALGRTETGAGRKRVFDIAYDIVAEGAKASGSPPKSASGVLTAAGLRESDDTKTVRGPVTLSRRRGTMSTKGLAPKDGSDKNYILRRALLLRSLCERKLIIKNAGPPVSPNILWAMLLVPEYKYGARSLAAVLEMSISENAAWDPAPPPFYSGLSRHVDANAFIKLVQREAILDGYNEKLARAIHENYCKKAAERGVKETPNLRPWEMLPEDTRDSNRAQARGIIEKLNMIGFTYDAGDTPFPSVLEFDEQTILLLAQSEHIRWIGERISSGWAYGAERDDDKKVHPMLVQWDELPEEEKQKNVDAARNIIPLLKSIGLRVFQTI